MFVDRGANHDFEIAGGPVCILFGKQVKELLPCELDIFHDLLFSRVYRYRKIDTASAQRRTQ
jgi:hypothetical protein